MNQPGVTADSTLPNWRVYERIVAALERENLGSGIAITSTPNARLIGAMRRVDRQVDLLVEARWDNYHIRRILVDAKHYGRPLDVKDIETFEGMMRDCRADHGILVCPNGWSHGAERRAQDLITLKLLTLDEASQRTEWAIFEECYGPCQRALNPHRRGVVLWNGELPVAVGPLWAIVWTGKCDVCHCFQVWCWDCGGKFALAIGASRTCGCERQWSAAILDDTDNSTARSHKAAHLLFTIENDTISIDRRSVTS